MNQQTGHRGFGVVADSFSSAFPFDSIEERLAFGDDPACLYRYFDADGSLLYVGMSKHPEIRDEQHWMTRSEWRGLARSLRMDLFGSRHHASRAEQIAIAREEPLWNTQRFPLGKSDGEVPCAPDGERRFWATVADYSGWWSPPTLIPEPPPLTPSQTHLLERLDAQREHDARRRA